MNVVGGVLGLVVGLLFVVVVVAFAQPVVPGVVPAVRPPMIVAFAIVLFTLYAIVSSWITTALGNVLTALFPTAFAAYCALSLLYLIVTILWVVFFFFPFIASGAAASFLIRAAQTPSWTTSNQASTPAAPLLLFLLLAPLHIIVTAVLYVVAGSPGTPAQAELFVRGLLVGWNAAVNGILGTLFFASMVPSAGGRVPIISVIFGVIAGMITLLGATTQRGWNTWNAVVRAILGWSTPFLPTAWPVVMLGWILYFCNHAVNGTAGWFSPGGFYSIRRISFWFGTHVTEGGVVANSSLQRPPNVEGTGWDLGSFAFITSMHAANLPVPAATAVFSDLPTIEHESGHNLNLAAFGTWFHFIGALDENVPPFARHRHAYAEQLAESNVPATTAPSIFMWT